MPDESDSLLSCDLSSLHKIQRRNIKDERKDECIFIKI